jgi:hypothetical protein
MVMQLIHVQLCHKEPILETEYEVGLLYKWIFPECVVHWFTPPIKLGLILQRIKNTYEQYDAKRIKTNLEVDSIPHLFGEIFNKVLKS